jgi:hypothetical protein
MKVKKSIEARIVTDEMCAEHHGILHKSSHVKKSDHKFSDEYYKNKPKIKHTSRQFKLSQSLDEEHEKVPKKK